MYSGGGASRARDWVIEGSNDKIEWITLMNHVDDRNLEATDDDYGTFTWHLEQTNATRRNYQQFRFRMTKPAHDGDWYFAVCGVELYGNLYLKK